MQRVFTFVSGVRLHHELWGSGSSSSDWYQAQTQDGQGRTGHDGQSGGGEVPVGQGRVGQASVNIIIVDAAMQCIKPIKTNSHV